MIPPGRRVPGPGAHCGVRLSAVGNPGRSQGTPEAVMGGNKFVVLLEVLPSADSVSHQLARAREELARLGLRILGVQPVPPSPLFLAWRLTDGHWRPVAAGTSKVALRREVRGGRPKFLPAGCSP